MNPETIATLILKCIRCLSFSRMTEFFITEKPIVEARISKPDNQDYYRLVVAFKPGKQKESFTSITVPKATLSEDFDNQPYRKKIETSFKIYSADYAKSPKLWVFRLKPNDPNFDYLYDDLTLSIRRSTLIPRFVRVKIIEDKNERLIQALKEFSEFQSGD